MAPCELVCREFSFADEDYRKSLVLREEVLRLPINLRLSQLDTEQDCEQLHFGVFCKGDLVACVVVKFLDGSGVVKLRQMAVREQYRSKGVGAKLLLYVEQVLADAAVFRIELSARVEASPFYKKLGYKRGGSVYVEQGIPHIKMVKSLMF
jgi:predicted GNAT family N-acyltransferase